MINLGPEVTIDYSGGSCPFQAWGSIGTERFFFRYRWDHARLEIGPAGDDPDIPARPAPLVAHLENVSGDRYRGSLSDDEAEALMRELFTRALGQNLDGQP